MRTVPLSLYTIQYVHSLARVFGAYVCVKNYVTRIPFNNIYHNNVYNIYIIYVLCTSLKRASYIYMHHGNRGWQGHRRNINMNVLSFIQVFGVKSRSKSDDKHNNIYMHSADTRDELFETSCLKIYRLLIPVPRFLNEN